MELRLPIFILYKEEVTLGYPYEPLKTRVFKSGRLLQKNIERCDERLVRKM